MNIIWNAQKRPGEQPPSEGFLGTVRTWIFRRLFSLLLVFVVGLLLITSMFASSALAFALDQIDPPPGLAIARVGDVIFSILLITFVFALMFKYIPDVRVRWRDVWLGAAVTSLLFNLGKFGISTYLGQSSIASTFGAAGSLVVVLMWVYYSCQIVFFGAELTQVLSDRDRRRSAEKAMKPEE